MYTAHSEIPSDIASFFILLAGVDAVEQIPLEDINGFAVMMTEQGPSVNEDFIRELYEGVGRN
jgi:hypothetical protein